MPSTSESKPKTASEKIMSGKTGMQEYFESKTAIQEAIKSFGEKYGVAAIHETIKFMEDHAASMEEDQRLSKAAAEKSTELLKAKSMYSLEENKLYKETLETLTFLQYQSVMNSGKFGRFMIHPDDKSDLKCREDLAKYICYGQQAKDAARAAAKGAARKTAKEAGRRYSGDAYEARLAQVTELVRQFYGTEEIEPTDDFKEDLGMDDALIYLLFNEIHRRWPGGGMSAITNHLYKLRCCQEVADWIHALSLHKDCVNSMV